MSERAWARLTAVLFVAICVLVVERILAERDAAQGRAEVAALRAEGVVKDERYAREREDWQAAKDSLEIAARTAGARTDQTIERHTEVVDRVVAVVDSALARELRESWVAVQDTLRQERAAGEQVIAAFRVRLVEDSLHIGVLTEQRDNALGRAEEQAATVARLERRLRGWRLGLHIGYGATFGPAEVITGLQVGLSAQRVICLPIIGAC